MDAACSERPFDEDRIMTLMSSPDGGLNEHEPLGRRTIIIRYCDVFLQLCLEASIDAAIQWLQDVRGVGRNRHKKDVMRLQ